MTERIERMYADLKGEKKFVFCGEKYRIVIDSWRKHEGLTPVLKRAQATADYFDQRTLYVDPDELIVGNVASKPHGLEASVWGPFWDDEDLDSIIADGQYSISDEDRKALREGDSFWEGQDRQMYEWQGRFYDDERLWPFIKSGVLCPPWTDKKKGRGSGGAGFGWGLGIGLSFFVPDYGKIITEGIPAGCNNRSGSSSTHVSQIRRHLLRGCCKVRGSQEKGRARKDGRDLPLDRREPL